MRERPILFSAPMVRAILDGSKTVTRRIAKPIRHPDPGNVYAPGALVLEHEPQHVIDRCCPHGVPGDQLWVKETFYAWGRWETRYSAKKGRDEWHFVDMTLECGKAYLYAADGPRPQPLAGKRDGGTTPKWWKRPSIHMPRWASRITLEVTGVRVERLQDISEADALAEGVSAILDEMRRATPRCDFQALWQSINGPGSWDANPWVWIVEFKRIKP